MRESFWTREWFLGLVIGLIAVVAAALGQMHRFDYMVYDTAMRLASAAPTPRIAIIAIDAKSIDSLGPWPWPRSRLANLLDVIAPGKPTAVAATLPLGEAQIDPGLAAIHQLQRQYADSSLPRASKTLSGIRHDVLLSARTMGRRAPQTLSELDRYLRKKAPLRALSGDLGKLHATLNSLEQHLNTDRILAQAIKRSGNVDLSMSFEPGITQGNPGAPLPGALAKNLLHRLAAAKQDRPQALSAYSIQPPMPEFTKNARGIGIFAPSADEDGRIRRTSLAVRYYQHYLPSLGLLLALQSLNLAPDKVSYRNGIGLVAGSLTIRTSTELQLRPRFYRGTGADAAFTTYSFADVLNGNVSPEVFRDKIVLIGLTAPSIAPQFNTAADTRSPPVDILADEVSSILNQDAFYTPPWALWVKLLVWAAVLAYLILLLPLLGNRIATVTTLLLFSGLLVSMLYPLINHGVWIALAGPSLLLACGQFMLLLKRRVSSGRGFLPATADTIENARMLGLAFQGQGQLDLAFDRFRQLPTGEPVFELLYNLALDYERRRRFSKAHDVYAYIHRHDRHYRDVKDRLKRTESLSDVKLSPVRANGNSDIANAGTLILETDGLQKPMLGRYEIDREIGRGAMSVVYEGRDPKIGRVVAIKTLPLSSEFDADELDQVKRRFYREAETAGRLSHPNIVTVHDVGEEHDLAYIAMEYLKGRNLTHFLNREHLLPTSTVLEIIAKCAVALDYAHQHHVVHRDVKPANIVYDVDSNTVKLTDFGIARITDASRTKTGTVMGTPSYMSPEQLAGQRLDGRADLFSLGITCFQLLTGRLPFQADTMASLMYKITNEAHPALNSLRDDLAPCVSPIINKVLQKNPDRRFQTGREMAERLIQCAHDIRKMNT